MVCIPFAFKPIAGSHTGLALKQQYDSIVNEFRIKDKAFKIVADSAANNKKAFKEQFEASDESHISAQLLIKQKKSDLFNAALNLLKTKTNYCCDSFCLFN